ncbi:MAG: hypothetical protein WC479_00345 [Candidatus Izemoplasmatales bacterium]
MVTPIHITPVMNVDPYGLSWKSFWSSVGSFFTSVGNIFSGVYDFVTNTSETAVIENKFISFYKGQLVIRHNIPNTTSWSIFGIMFINLGVKNDQYGIDTIKHEYGHTVQEARLGTYLYIFRIAVPSVYNCIIGTNNYYSQPWERSADWFGGVNRGNYSPDSLEKSFIYFFTGINIKCSFTDIDNFWDMVIGESNQIGGF